MKATLATRDLKTALAETKRSLGNRANLPALSGVRVTVDSIDGVTLATTDLELTTWARVDTADALDDGHALVPFAALDKIARKVDGDTVTLHVNGDPDRLRIVSGDADVSLRTMPADDYPPLPQPDGVDWRDHSDHLAWFAAMVETASSDDARPVLTGVWFGDDGIVATDSYRLAWAATSSHLHRLVPSRALDAVRKSKVKTLTAAPGADNPGAGLQAAWFHGATGRLTLTWHSRTIVGKFPDYPQFWPDKTEGAVTVDRQRLRKVVDRIGSLTGTQPVVLAIDSGRLTVEGGTGETGEASESVAVETGGEPPERIAFNPRYLTGGLGMLDGDRVTVELRDEVKPAVIRDAEGGDEFGYLLMPVRV
ncbi:DNA polymerase III subunit beta [Egibacter rhizosphaerae]|uniref:DNA polymerase III subunit beta n=1 Tax=Egibacter rhizosphaerae TaxID=1670831 RepID=A0A411YDL7_9ACTN|nr:DNA polymerase III subunit beta [Egibacter rhizosphaerae]QBI19329.1 DNA polymerase III subunit beta [Egibacter rhizosphaerae]